MRYAKEERLQIYSAAQLGLVQFEKNADKQSKYVDFIDYYANLSEQEIDEYRAHYLNDKGKNKNFFPQLLWYIPSLVFKNIDRFEI